MVGRYCFRPVTFTPCALLFSTGVYTCDYGVINPVGHGSLSCDSAQTGWGEMHPVPSRRGARSDEVPVGGADE
jgi:hypothetical protein